MSDNLNDLINMVNHGKNVNSAYLTTALMNAGNYIYTNSDAITQITSAINSNLAELDFIQNELNTANNLNQETLVKKDQLLRMKNDDLMKQLKELEIIQSTITNKDRLIEQTNNNISEQESNIKILVISSILAIILLIAFISNGFNQISNNYLLIVVITVIVCYFILFIYSYNIFYFKTAITYLFDRKSMRLGNELKNWSQHVKSELEDELFGKKVDWVNNNCACPIEDESEPDSYARDQNITEESIPGQFYYDGSSPQQLLVPTPESPTLSLTKSIDWVDYSQDGQVKYNRDSNKVSYDNKNYYNYNVNSKDPANILLNELNNSTALVNNKTNTANI